VAGSYAYFYSDIVVRRLGLYVYLGVFTLLWAEMLVIRMVADRVPAESAIIALALTGLAVHLLQPILPWMDDRPTAGLIRAGLPLGLFLSTVPVLMGLMLHLRATCRPLNESWPTAAGGRYAITWVYVLAMFTTAASCRVGAHMRRDVPWLSAAYFFGAAAATLMCLAGLLSLGGIEAWAEMAPIVMLVPIAYLVAARLYCGRAEERPLVWTAHAATAVMIVAVLASATHLAPQQVVEPVVGKPLNLLLAAFFAEAAAFYALAAAPGRQGFNVYLGTATACGALWQLLQFAQIGAEYYTLGFALLGLGLLACYRLALLQRNTLVDAAFQCANALLWLSLVSAGLMTLSRLAVRPDAIHWPLAGLLLALCAVSLLSAWLVGRDDLRRWYLVFAVAEAGLAFFCLCALSRLSAWDKLEIFCVAAGAALLAVGHIGWHREQGRQTDLVSFSLLGGSLLVALPLTIAVVARRVLPVPEFSTPNELGMLVMGILLLASGCVCRLRATTIAGAVMLAVYVFSLVLWINMLENVQTAAIWIAIGGGALFAAGILLSVYRDRLLALPEKMQRREGVFRVLDWR